MIVLSQDVDGTRDGGVPVNIYGLPPKHSLPLSEMFPEFHGQCPRCNYSLVQQRAMITLLCGKLSMRIWPPIQNSYPSVRALYACNLYKFELQEMKHGSLPSLQRISEWANQEIPSNLLPSWGILCPATYLPDIKVGWQENSSQLTSLHQNRALFLPTIQSPPMNLGGGGSTLGQIKLVNKYNRE